MARIFLDANVFIDYVEARKDLDLRKLANNSLFISPLSIHIISYLYKYEIPETKLKNIDIFSLVPFDLPLTKWALIGPTVDFEDNIQLHSAISAQCEIFLTSDNKLLKLGIFGNLRIQNTI